MWNLKYNTNEHIYKTETDSQVQKTNQWIPVGRGSGEGQDSGMELRDTNYCV